MCILWDLGSSFFSGEERVRLRGGLLLSSQRRVRLAGLLFDGWWCWEVVSTQRGLRYSGPFFYCMLFVGNVDAEQLQRA